MQMNLTRFVLIVLMVIAIEAPLTKLFQQTEIDGATDNLMGFTLGNSVISIQIYVGIILL